MMHTTQAIYDECRHALVEVEQQIEAVKKFSERLHPIHEQPDLAAVFKLQNVDGTFVMAPLLAAKADLLSSLARLKAADTIAKMPAGKRGGW